MPSDDYGGYNLHDKDIIISGCRLICTCGACPEQYEVFDENTKKQIGYLRLRHGWFRADYSHCGDETVYEAHPEGDGVFADHERMKYLTEAVAALLERHNRNDTTNDNS